MPVDVKHARSHVAPKSRRTVISLGTGLVPCDEDRQRSASRRQSLLRTRNRFGIDLSYQSRYKPRVLQCGQGEMSGIGQGIAHGRIAKVRA